MTRQKKSLQHLLKLDSNMTAKQSQKGIVTRIPPSPTGHLHIGTVRTALFNYLFARKNGGTFIYRSEDTDTERSTEAFETEIREGLEWLGLIPDEYHKQSERSHVYERYIEQLLERDVAYTSKEPSKKEPGKEIEVVRLRNSGKEITFIDEIRGDVTFDTTELGDFIIARSKTDALYHLAVVIDDYEMGVTHVIRGEDHISNTPRQILIQEAIGATRPVYAHLPLILAPDRSKMSKRHGAVSLLEYRTEGFLSQAVVNYLALLGWNPGTDQEIFTLDELVQVFDIGGVQKGGAIFDKEKMIWINKEHLNRLSDDAFLSYVKPALDAHAKNKEQYGDERVEKLISTLRERTETLQQLQNDLAAGEYDFAFESPRVEKEMLKWKNDATPEDALPRLRKVTELLTGHTGEITPEVIKAVLWPYAEETGKGEVLWPLRVALTGRERSPDPFTVISVLGIEESVHRIKKAYDTISA